MRRRRPLASWRWGEFLVYRGCGRRLGPRRPRDSGGTSRLGEPDERVATAALALGALVLLAVLPADSPEAVRCPQPRELESHAAWTTAVVCGVESERQGELRGPVKLLFGGTLDLNQVEVRGLEALPAIGPTRAAAIALARAEQPFRSLEDLERVPGIGPAIARGLRGWVGVLGPSEVAADQ